MTEQKVATPEIARATWEEMVNPSVRRVEEKLKAAGYVTPSYRTINKWQKGAEQLGKPWTTRKAPRAGKISKARQHLDDATPALTGDPRSKAEDIVEAAFKALPPPDEPEQERPEQPTGDDPDAQRRQDEQEARARLKAIRDIISGNDISDELLLTTAARQTLKTAIIIEAVLGELAPALIAEMPEAVGKLQLAVAESLAAAGEPYDRVGRARELAMKTISSGGGNATAEVIPPGSDDPLADSLAAFKKRHAA
ncbi:hypothetical protein I6F35_33650 [Bradyrhizobium sp. BRP22]|uniref:hypothetical protein n=1 Tax=Bradyrhizobium sp. BRP22 TaxID=2793821 RepID=UPI001CD4554E|nr:hypothetical protein [Bradyrhizobium sp. BRP22]MCA1458081.1 hypothetical protein [Bradyrhizobium sp. BRP22]